MDALQYKETLLLKINKTCGIKQRSQYAINIFENITSLLSRTILWIRSKKF